MPGSNPPTDRAGQRRWLLAREEAVARFTRKALRSIIGEATASFTDSLTAAGDLTSLDSIVSAWMTFVEAQLAPTLGETHLSGAMTAWLGLNAAPPDAFAEAWGAVTNEAAVSYMSAATNRLTQVGEDAWRRIRAQTVNALRDGLTGEQLKTKIEGLTQFTEARADMIARTETVGAYVQGDMAGARALGDRGPTEKVWVATYDRRTRESHAEAHNQVRRMGEPFDVGGVLMDAPHAPGAPAREVVNCRCYCEHLYPGDARPDGSLAEGSGVAGPVRGPEFTV